MSTRVGKPVSAGHEARLLENIQHVAVRALNDVESMPTSERVSKNEEIVPERMSVGEISAPEKASSPTFPLVVLSMESIQAGLTKLYPQGWVLAWTEAVTKPPINPSDGRSAAARTEWSDSCAANGSISQTLGLAVFLTDSIKHNVIRRKA